MVKLFLEVSVHIQSEKQKELVEFLQVLFSLR